MNFSFTIFHYTLIFQSNFLILDYVVVMRPGGYPVAIQNRNKNESKMLLEDITESTDNLV